MSDPSYNLLERATLYATTRVMQLSFQLGYGKDGEVYSTSVGSAVKTFRQSELFDRELACYSRLSETATHNILGFRVPQLLGFDKQLLVIEMSIVQRPFLLDFASAYLDEEPDFPDEVIDQWQQAKQEEFGSHWPRVVILLEVLKQSFGIHLLDVHPGKIAFDETPPD